MRSILRALIRAPLLAIIAMMGAFVFVAYSAPLVIPPDDAMSRASPTHEFITDINGNHGAVIVDQPVARAKLTLREYADQPLSGISSDYLDTSPAFVNANGMETKAKVSAEAIMPRSRHQRNLAPQVLRI